MVFIYFQTSENFIFAIREKLLMLQESGS